MKCDMILFKLPVFSFILGMATNIGALKEKSKSETPRQNNRVKFRRPPKYKSMTLRRQEGTYFLTFLMPQKAVKSLKKIHPN